MIPVADPVASILIPTLDRATSLEIAVASVLAQSVREIEVIIIGDGSPQSMRTRVAELQGRDDRVRFLDKPKGANHGETYRHEAILAARSNAIFYLCDDDLMLPDHVSDLLKILERRTFAQSLNGYINGEGGAFVYAADLSNPDVIRAITTEELRFNTVSITGTAHRRDFYLEANEPWTTTPTGEWPDHFQWKKLMRNPAFSAETSLHMTALQFPTSQDGRDTWTEDERIAELSLWAELVRAPDAQARVDQLVYGALWRQVCDAGVLARDAEANTLSREAQATAERARQVHEVGIMSRELEQRADEVNALALELAATKLTLSWRVTRPLRAIRRWQSGFRH
jgi:hypothetical protein